MDKQYMIVPVILAAYVLVFILILIFDPATQEFRDKFKRLWKKK